jgi:hypothetical protein
MGHAKERLAKATPVPQTQLVRNWLYLKELRSFLSRKRCFVETKSSRPMFCDLENGKKEFFVCPCAKRS